MCFSWVLSVASRHCAALVALLSLFIAGCATTYGPVGFGGGFSDTVLQSDVFRVSFRGNGFTSEERVADFALLRAADLAIYKEYPYFIVVDEKGSSSTGYINTPVYANTQGTYSSYGNTGYYQGKNSYSGGHSVPVNKHSASLTIKCFMEKPDFPGIAYNARELSANIRSKYRLDPPPIFNVVTPEPVVLKKTIVLKDGSVVIADSVTTHETNIQAVTAGGVLTIPKSEIAGMQ